MRKVLCSIETVDIDDYVLCVQNIATYGTLLQIKEANGSLTSEVKTEIVKGRIKSERALWNWWERTTQKYEIPYYTDTAMLVDTQRQVIYIEE